MKGLLEQRKSSYSLVLSPCHPCPLEKPRNQLMQNHMTLTKVCLPLFQEELLHCLPALPAFRQEMPLSVLGKIRLCLLLLHYCSICSIIMMGSFFSGHSRIFDTHPRPFSTALSPMLATTVQRPQRLRLPQSSGRKEPRTRERGRVSTTDYAPPLKKLIH